ncbi:MAG: transcriptional regulator NrdR [Gemmatimonadota bacterium]|nr:transcriptional regulator NrdR [Gemmatimonadota bacterium]MDE2728204.1 transcriptional regulator NrdR [Gemmatimonadota bacterium]
MRCPACGTLNSHVVDSRTIQSGRTIRRRRECLSCTKRFTTYEAIEEEELMVVKSDGRREVFDRGKIMHGLKLACTKRMISADQLHELVDRVVYYVSNLNEREIPSNRIGEFIIRELRKIDEVAYVRFASVYRDFKDRSEFAEELEQLEKQELAAVVKDQPDQG